MSVVRAGAGAGSGDCDRAVSTGGNGELMLVAHGGLRISQTLPATAVVAVPTETRRPAMIAALAQSLRREGGAGGEILSSDTFCVVLAVVLRHSARSPHSSDACSLTPVIVTVPVPNATVHKCFLQQHSNRNSRTRVHQVVLPADHNGAPSPVLTTSPHPPAEVAFARGRLDVCGIDAPEVGWRRECGESVAEPAVRAPRRRPGWYATTPTITTESLHPAYRKPSTGSDRDLAIWDA